MEWDMNKNIRMKRKVTLSAGASVRALSSPCIRTRADKWSASAIVTLMLATLSAGAMASQDTASEIEELKRRLDSIEARVDADAEIKASLQQIRDDIMRLEQKTAGADSTLNSVPVEAADDGKGEVASAEIASAEYAEPGKQGTPIPLQRDSQYLTGEDLEDAAFPGSLPIPGTSARFKVGGYAKLDMIYDFDNVGDRYEFELATIPVEGTPEYELDGQTTFQAKESRLNFDFRNVVRNDKYGWEFPVQGFLEIDFFDDRDSSRFQPRLRQAYGVIGRLLAGRSWGITTDLGALAGTIDFSGGDSLYGGRVSQIRWQDKIGESVGWAVGLEEATSSISNPFGLEGADRSSLPNLAGHIRWEAAHRGHVQFGLDLFQMEWQGGASGPDDKEVGYGASLSGHYLLGDARKDGMYLAATVGSGAAHRVISLSFDGGNDAVITPDGLDAMGHKQVYGGISHYWNDSLNSTLSLAWAELDNSSLQADNAIHQAESAHINLIWFPYKKVSTGVEYMWGRRENKDGADGTAQRIQFMTKFVFN